MNPSEYQQAAARTECDQRESSERMSGNSLVAVRLNHAIIGLTGELGELASLIEKSVYYGQTQNLRLLFKEELGDCLWYIALACNALNLDLAEVMAANIRKLKERYPDKYSDDRAAHRNLSQETSALRGLDDPKLGEQFLDINEEPDTDQHNSVAELRAVLDEACNEYNKRHGPARDPKENE